MFWRETPTHSVLTSGDLELNTGLRQLRRRKQIIPLSGLPFRILELLIRANGRVVSRAELKQSLWPHAIRIDVDRRLNTAVRAIRKALDGHLNSGGELITVRGYGYRWVAAPPQAAKHFGHLTLVAAVASMLVGASAAQLNRLADRTGSEQQTNEFALIEAADLKLSADWDWAGAEALYRTALARQPDLPEAHRGLAWLYVNRRRPADALPHIVRLLEFPGQNAAQRAELGWLLIRTGKPDAALAICSTPDEPAINLLSCRHTALAQLGLIAEARDSAVRVMRAASADRQTVERVRRATPGTGYSMFLHWRVAHFVEPAQNWFQRAQLQAEAGLYREALQSLETAVERRDPLLVKIGSTAAFAPLHSLVRFRRIADMVLSGMGPPTTYRGGASARPTPSAWS